MRRWIKLSLFASVATSAVSIALFPESNEATPGGQSNMVDTTNTTATYVPAQPKLVPLPGALPVAQIDNSKFDPFIGLNALENAKSVASSQTEKQAEVIAPPLPLPTAPPLDFKYVGRLMSPDGNTKTYISDGRRELPISPGVALPNGYLVKDVSEREITLIYPPLGVNAYISIPSRSHDEP